MAVALWAAAMPASAQPLAALRYAPDVTISLGATLVGGDVGRVAQCRQRLR